MKFTSRQIEFGLFMMLRSLILILAILPTFAAENIKAVGAVSKANIKAIGAVAEANIKAFGAVDNTASGGGVFVNDTMTDSNGTDLTAHTGETGATWAKVTGATGIIKITSNRCKGDSGGLSLYYASGTPADADYTVQADLFVVSAIDEAGICGRLSTGANTCYRLWYDHSNSRWELSKVVAGVVTPLDTHAQSLSVSSTYAIKLEMIGTAIKGYIDGVEQLGVTDGDISAAGKAGIFYNNSDWGFGTTGRAIDNFTATD